MYFLGESYGHGSFSEMQGRFAFVLPRVWIGGGIWIKGGIGTAAQHHCVLGIRKANCWLQIWFSSSS